MPPLQPGETAPPFTLATDSGQKVSLAELGDRPVVLFFYPKDDTPGCTIECKEFRDARAQFLERAEVFGISPDDAASHEAFRDKYALNFPLLSDPGHEVASRYGVWGPKKTGGEGILRTTFILQAGKVIRTFDSVTPTGHAAQVLAALP
jgi:peroxiredoxin Q/BCP